MNPRITAAAGFAVLALSIGPTATDPASAMSAYQWKKRPVVVFAARSDDPRLAEQRAALIASRPALAERDVVIVTVVGGAVSAELGPGPGLGADAMRRRFGVAKSEFRVLLVGKDGGTKISSATPVATATLLGTIDAMPMRQQEMGRR